MRATPQGRSILVTCRNCGAQIARHWYGWDPSRERWHYLCTDLPQAIVDLPADESGTRVFGVPRRVLRGRRRRAAGHDPLVGEAAREYDPEQIRGLCALTRAGLPRAPGLRVRAPLITHCPECFTRHPLDDPDAAEGWPEVWNRVLGRGAQSKDHP
jgi:hypothetical protein